MTSETQQKIIVRQWTLADVPAVQHIALTTWLATYSSFIPNEDIQAFFDTYYTSGALGEFCNAETKRGFIAEMESQAIGFAKTHFSHDDNKFYLNSLYVLPAHQGKGIGSELLKRSEEFALTCGADAVWLGVMNQNVAALAWYKRIGFEFVKEEPFTMGKTTVNHLIGCRKINP
ncbi:MAG: GNAT family N-acetyltransferase [Bacteroidota bacterium]